MTPLSCIEFLCLFPTPGAEGVLNADGQCSWIPWRNLVASEQARARSFFLPFNKSQLLQQRGVWASWRSLTSAARNAALTAGPSKSGSAAAAAVCKAADVREWLQLLATALPWQFMAQRLYWPTVQKEESLPCRFMWAFCCLVLCTANDSHRHLIFSVWSHVWSYALNSSQSRACTTVELKVVSMTK